MGKKLYLECYSGISGDMTVAALLDLGADPEVLDQVLKSLPLGGFHTVIARVKKSGLDVCDFSVVLDQDNHDHDMAYLHGSAAPSKTEPAAVGYHDADEHGHNHGHNHCPSHYFEHHHEHDQEHHHAHTHRGMKEIREILSAGEMTKRARNTALRIFEILAQAEAEAHGVPVEEVHFHEVGAVDSIVDITAAAVCLDNLNITEVIVPRLYEGTGFIRCQHGRIPVPVPAVVNIVRQHQLNLKITDIEGELVTPTGAAIAAAVRTSEKLPENFHPVQIGMGAGKREYECPGILRAMLLEENAEEGSAEKDLREQKEASDQEEIMQPGVPQTKAGKDRICCLQTDIDDSTGEILGYVMELLQKAGAREVHYAPIFMKKNRPAWELTVICQEKDAALMEAIIFRETTTIGIRKLSMERSVLKREFQTMKISAGETDVKICTLPDGTRRCYPEYESAAALARETGTPLQDIYAEIKREWMRNAE